MFLTHSLQFFCCNLYSSFRNFAKELCYYLFYFFMYSFNEFTAKTKLLVSPCLWDRSWIKLKTIYCSSSAHFKNSTKFFRFFLLSLFNVSFVPSRYWVGLQLISQTAHLYSLTHFISVWRESYFLSKIFKGFCFSTFSNLKVKFLRVECR